MDCFCLTTSATSIVSSSGNWSPILLILITFASIFSLDCNTLPGCMRVLSNYIWNESLVGMINHCKCPTYYSLQLSMHKIKVIHYFSFGSLEVSSPYLYGTSSIVFLVLLRSMFPLLLLRSIVPLYFFVVWFTFNSLG